jgi:ArsR family transcriptional regulator
MKLDVRRESAEVPTELRAVAEPVRWRILSLLAVEDLCVCHLVEELGVAQSVVSHHLRVLREAGLVESERFRYWTYYRIRPRPLERLAATLGGFSRRSPGTRRRPCD